MIMENKEVISSERDIVTVGSTFMEFLTIAVKFRWLLFWIVFISTAAASVYAVFSPKWYLSTASVFPAEKTDLLSSLSGLSSLAKGVTSGRGLAALTGGGTEADKYIAILKSATVTTDVISKFNLRKEYDLEDTYYDKTVKEWTSNLEIEMQDEGNLTISVYDKNPQRAADIVNYLITRLNEINTDLSVTNAKANREFVEKRYMQNISDINNLETGMKKFQEKYGVIAVPEQIEATVKSMALIYSDLYKKQIEYNVLTQRYGKDHPVTQTSKIEMDELQKKIDKLNNGTDSSLKDVRILIPFKEAPELGNEYLKIYRNLEIQYKILEFVQPLYEQAKVEEARNTPSVLVLDRPGPAERKSKPKISLYMLLAFVISLSFAIVLIMVIESFQRLNKSNGVRMSALSQIIRSDLKKIGVSRK